MAHASNTVVPMRESATAERGGEAAAPAAAPSAAKPRSAFLPLLLGLAAVLVWLGHQAWLLDQDRQQLQAAAASTAPRLEAANQVRRSLDLLAADTQRLADAGNGNARALVEELRRRGITISTTAPATAPATAPTTGAAAAPAASR